MQNNAEKSCSCQSNNMLVVDKKTVSRVIAFLLLAWFFTFVIGYFWGKRHAVSTFAQKIEQESFADKIYYNTSLLYDQKTPQSTREEATKIENEQLKEEHEQISLQSATKSSEAAKLYQAQIFGGTQKAAQACCQRLQKNGIPVSVVKRLSKTPKNKTITWYQVVTEPFTNRQELELVLESVKFQEKIRDDIHIIELADRANDQKKGQ